MAHPGTVLEAVGRSIKNDPTIGDSVAVLTHEVGDSDADVPLPAVVLQTVSAIRADRWNTDLVGYETDANGNHIGRIFDAVFEMRLQIDVWVADSMDIDVETLAHHIRKALYRHDAHQLGEPFEAPDGSPMDDITHFCLANGERTDDLTMNDDLRRFTQEADVHFYERINTAEKYGAEDYIATVNTPSDGDATDGTDVDIILSPTA